MIYVLIPTTPDREDRLQKAIASVKRSMCDQPIEIIVEYNNYEGMIKPLLRMVNRVDGLAILITNDIEIMPSTIQELYNAYIKNFPDNDGLVGWGDGLIKLDEMCFPFAHTKVLREIIHPAYFHNFADRDWTAVMKLRGKYLAVTRPLCTHNHYSRNPALKDKTYEVNESTSDADSLVYAQRKEKNFQKITAVLITREKEYPKKIDTSWFDEVIIKTECPNIYTRYTEAEKAKNEIIYVQDDDCIVDYKELWKHYNGLTAGITPHHFNAYQGSGVTLVGWGCFFPKSMLLNIQKYIDRYGKDEHLMREADRIFTFLNQPHNNVIMEHQDFTPQTGRMWNEPSHWESMRQAIIKLKQI